MDSIKRLNRAIRYIEDHLTDEIEMKEVARIALSSEYHFSRMFSFLAGVSLSEYIRRRRLTLAGFELTNSDRKIMDLAVKYGYRSADAFSRSFQSFHGITPSEARERGQGLKAFPMMTFQLSIQGGMEMDYRIEEKEAFRIVGVTKRVPIQFEGENPAIAAMWQNVMAISTRLKELPQVEPEGIIQASVNFDEGRMEEKGELDQYIGVATTSACPEDLACLEVAPSNWAVFTVTGAFPQAMQDVWGRIYSEWFPSSTYELVAGPEMVKVSAMSEDRTTARSEIWIPVRKASYSAE